MTPNTTTQTRTSFVALSFIFMAIALAVSGTFAYLFGNQPELTASLYNINTDGKHALSIFGWVVLLAPIGMVLLMSSTMHSASLPVMLMLFLIFSVLEGMGLSVIFLVYSKGSIVSMFFITAGMFSTTAAYGFLTNTDLTKLGNIAFMGLIGIVIAMLVNMFLHSSTADYLISIIGVLVFTVLTAHDTQKLKNLGADADAMDDDNRGKLALSGALTLYLDFVNMFLFLLRLFGNKK